MPIILCMENKGKLIDKILKDFLSGEAEATDMRIISYNIYTPFFICS